MDTESIKTRMWSFVLETFVSVTELLPVYATPETPPPDTR